MNAPHPQVVAVLERVARSPLPLYHTLPPFVARRIYRDTRAVLAPPTPEVAEAKLMLAPGPASPVMMRAYRPKGAARDEVLPALVYFHGGGYVIGDPDTHDVLCRQLANGARCAVFSVDYRLAPEARFPAALEDCVAATRHVWAQAKDLQVDPQRIAVGGDSAGGNLAAVVSLIARDAGTPKICFQLLIYPGIDMRAVHPSHERNGEGYLLTKHTIKYFMDHYLPNVEERADWRASPLLAKSLAGLPPAFLLTAGFDPLVDEGREYAERLAKEGNEVSYREYPDMIHGFITFGGVLDTANEAVAECCTKLRSAFELVTA
jgi:acetyl esterase